MFGRPNKFSCKFFFCHNWLVDRTNSSIFSQLNKAFCIHEYFWNCSDVRTNPVANIKKSLLFGWPNKFINVKRTAYMFLKFFSRLKKLNCLDDQTNWVANSFFFQNWSVDHCTVDRTNSSIFSQLNKAFCIHEYFCNCSDVWTNQVAIYFFVHNCSVDRTNSSIFSQLNKAFCIHKYFWNCSDVQSPVAKINKKSELLGQSNKFINVQGAIYMTVT